MNRQQILDLYAWEPGVCFRHPAEGEQLTTAVGAIHPRDDGRREVRACERCVVAMEDIRREGAVRAGRQYEPGRLGDAPR